MHLDLPKQTRSSAIASLQQYFRENLAEPIGDLAAGLLLDFFLTEIGPVVYNQAVADAQAQIVKRASDLSSELYAEEFSYWRKRRTK